MSGHDRTDGQGWRRAGLRALAWAAWAWIAASATADELAPANDPVNLAGQRLWAWNDAGVRWVAIAGEAAVLQGAEGLRSGKALARIATTPTGHRVEVRAEGDVRISGRPGRSARTGSTSLSTPAGVNLQPYTPNSLAEVEGPPPGFESLLGQFGPPPTPPSAAVPVAEVAANAEPVSDTPPAPAAVVAEPPPTPLPTPPTAGAPPVEPADVDIKATQFSEGFSDGMPGAPSPEGDEPVDGAPDDETDTTGRPETDLIPLPGGDQGAAGDGPPEGQAPLTPFNPGSQRITSIYRRDGGPNFDIKQLPTREGEPEVTVIRGGVVVLTQDPKIGIVDITADSVIAWRGKDKFKTAKVGPGGEVIESSDQPLEFYLEGNVVFRQDERKVAGNSDQRTYRASRAYYDTRTDRFLALDAEVNIFSPNLIAPIRETAPSILQYRPLETLPNGQVGLGLARIRADQTTTTGSRFPTPGYRFNSKSVDLTRKEGNLVDLGPNKPKPDPDDPDAKRSMTWRIDARQNVFFLGPLPVFYWPRFEADADDIDPPIRQFGFRSNNYFGQQVLTDWNGFKLFNLRKPAYINNWNVDIDYLSYRGFALGSEVSFSGRELIPDVAGPFFGYFDLWGLKDYSNDNLGSGPAIVTDRPPGDDRGFDRSKVPPFQDFRGRILYRHMQSLAGPDDDPLDDFRLQLEGAYVSDRHFLEQYYKRLFETGLDQSTLAYAIRQKQNRAFSVLVEANLQDFYTESQWLPKLDYYRLGDAPFGRFTYFQHSGIDYANTHTAVEVNNAQVVPLIPVDPISNTTGVLKTGRAYTSHELDLPIDLQFVRFVPYLQGQAIAWNNQINGESLGRVWGAAGARADVMAWKAYPKIESELLNIHGINHKINFQVDYRTTYSDVRLDRIGVQDDLDDNTYEYVRRYFAFNSYAGGLLPAQYDPRFLTLRRGSSPITGSTDIQDTIQTARLGISQKFQTKRGPEGRRRIIDYMIFDVGTTYFPNADRDNFGESLGQTMYNSEWFVGDRTSIVSTGWIDTFNIGGLPQDRTNGENRSNEQGIFVNTTGVQITRPPRSSVFLGYTIVNTGPIKTSALNASYSYQLSPKWYSTYGTSYDFGNEILLNALFSVTRIGADYLTTIGLNVDPQRESYSFAFELTPRISPNLRVGGSGNGIGRFDPRYAPTQ